MLSCGINTLWRTWSFWHHPTLIVFHHMRNLELCRKMLTKFVADRADNFLTATRLKSKLESADRSRVTEEVVQRASIFASTYQTKCNDTSKRQHTHKSCPSVWDPWATAGLTPFRCDFIYYTECQIPVNNITRTNMVVGIGTTLHRFIVNGDPVYLSRLSYHLPTAEIRLFSPQTYHTLYGGHSTCLGVELLR